METRICTFPGCGTEYQTHKGNIRNKCFNCAPKCQRRTDFMKRPDGTNMTMKERQAAVSKNLVEQGHSAVLVQVLP